MTGQTKVTDNGQVTIPKRIRLKHNITSNDTLKVSTLGSVIVIYKDMDSKTLSYSFLYNKILSMKEDLGRLESKYDEQQQNIIRQSAIIDELEQKVNKK